jgi:hypothetical protein
MGNIRRGENCCESACLYFSGSFVMREIHGIFEELLLLSCGPFGG